MLFSKAEAPYILSKPIHESQKKLKNNESGLLISIEVIPNYELEKLILSFGENIKIVSPKPFVEKMQKRIGAMKRNYK